MTGKAQKILAPTGNFRERRIRWTGIGLVMAMNLGLWLVPSRTGWLVSQGNPVLLGRYSVERMALLVVLAPASLAIIWLLTSTTENFRPRLGKLSLTLIALLLLLPVADLVLRRVLQPRYEITDQIYRRPPNQKFRLIINDRPEATMAPATMRPGYPPFACTLSTDARGFRNRDQRARYDVVCLGDSFVEGANVSDNDTWPVLVSGLTGLSVYNLGVSGAYPVQYYHNLLAIGIPLQPRYLICMIYEGNDFRRITSGEQATLSEDWRTLQDAAALPRSPWPRRWHRFMRTSPLCAGGRRLLVAAFGGIGSGPSPATPGLGWHPFGWPPGEATRYYAPQQEWFFPLLTPREDFVAGENWSSVALALTRIHEVCLAHDIRMVVVFAPSIANVLLPAIVANVPPEEIHAFLKLERNGLPEVDELYPRLLAGADLIENVVADFCAVRNIEFIRIKSALRAATDRGRQCYFTYDQHWTPIGHQVAAAIVAERLQQLVAEMGTETMLPTNETR